MKILNQEINKNLILFLLGLGITLFVFIFLITTNEIGQSVKDKCLVAQEKYSSNDCVDALIQTLENPQEEIGTRNHAIWALGQLGNEKALPFLKSYYTGKIPEREPWEEVLSQYELKKAINLLEKKNNLSAPFWR